MAANLRMRRHFCFAGFAVLRGSPSNLGATNSPFSAELSLALVTMENDLAFQLFISRQGRDCGMKRRNPLPSAHSGSQCTWRNSARENP
jgi:hypothetical protein